MAGLIFVIVLLLLILLFSFLLCFEALSVRMERRCHHKRIYRILHHYAEEEDCYLLNDVRTFLSKDDMEPTKLDHILFTEKYIYLITDFLAFGGIYGNVKDASLFLKGPDGKIQTISNPILIGRNLVYNLEEDVMIGHEKNAFIAMTVYNPSLVVPKSIHVKNCESCFISVDELEETIRNSQEDSVSPFNDVKVKMLVDIIKERSDQVKEQLEKNKKK